MDILTRDFYNRDTLEAARDLLGRDIVRVLEDGTELVCRITETEAYIGRMDKAWDGLHLPDLRHVPLPEFCHRGGGGARRRSHPGGGPGQKRGYYSKKSVRMQDGRYVLLPEEQFS